MARRPEPPLKPRLFYILLALAEHDRHGLDVMREVLRLSDGNLRLWPVALYGTLADLVEWELIEELSGRGRHPEGESEQRRFYGITQRGRRLLNAETERLASLVKLSRRHNRVPDRQGASW